MPKMARHRVGKYSARELDNGLVGWFSSSNISGQDGIEAMNSLRDVADEVLYDEKWKIDRGRILLSG